MESLFIQMRKGGDYCSERAFSAKPLSFHSSHWSRKEIRSKVLYKTIEPLVPGAEWLNLMVC
ncbi:hypothetical protein [Runella rosea]|uniref:hypothetical protein n=1 Tax=Runella rosea TaxID=2259595 RepID=UPI0013B406BB|nr:hypothetical protein [Runella rosea]